MSNSLSGLHSMEYLLSNHNMMIGVNTISTGEDGTEQSIYDIRHLVRQKKIVEGMDPYGTGYYDETLDLNCDGVIDDADILLMRKLLLGVIKLSDLPIFENISIISE